MAFFWISCLLGGYRVIGKLGSIFETLFLFGGNTRRTGFVFTFFYVSDNYSSKVFLKTTKISSSSSDLRRRTGLL